MQYVNFYKVFLIIIVCIGAAFISGCSSTEQKMETLDKVTTQTEVTISAEELAQLKASSQQWQQAKAGVERLLIIEQDLKLLISQLNAVAQRESAVNSSNVSQPVITAEAEANKVTATDAVAPVEQIEEYTQPLFSLQVAAVTEHARLVQSFNEIKANAAELFHGEFIANVETIKINGVTYYRLKLGAYQYQKNANIDCNKLKLQQVNCIVSHYTDQPLKL